MKKVNSAEGFKLASMYRTVIKFRVSWQVQYYSTNHITPPIAALRSNVITVWRMEVVSGFGHLLST
jgi:hypothetical protein